MPLFYSKQTYVFADRETKARYVWLKYRTILENSSILDVGAGECHLKNHLPDSASYWGIGLGGYPDQQIDLEKENIPFPDDSFDCVLCLDVLEHLENIHEVFDELCRVSRRYVVISLPNPWADLYNVLRFGDYCPGQPMKFYGFPQNKTEDRHKWFFSNEDARCFVEYRAIKNDMTVAQINNIVTGGEPGNRVMRRLRKFARDFLFRKDLNVDNLYAGTLWAVLKKQYLTQFFSSRAEHLCKHGCRLVLTTPLVAHGTLPALQLKNKHLPLHLL